MSVTQQDEKLDLRAANDPGPPSYKSLLRAFFLRLCVAVTLGLILLAVVEFYSFKRYHNYGTRDALEAGAKLEIARDTSPNARQYWDEFEKSNKVSYHQYVLWRRAPYNGSLISVDSQGVRRTLFTQCDNQTFTIWMFGDSVMWGDGSPDSETIPSLVARHYQNLGKPACIVNYAEKGWSNTQEMLALIEELKHASRKPDVVLFYDGGTEAFAAYQNGEADVHSNFGLFKGFLDSWGSKQRASFDYLRETNTYRFLRNIATRLPFDQKNAGANQQLDIETLSSAVITNYLQNMEIIGLLAKQYNFRPVFAWYPNLAVGHKVKTPDEREVLRLYYEEFPRLDLMYQRVYQKSSEIKSADFFNLENAIDDKSDSLYVGISHMKPAGDRIMADRLFDILQGKQTGQPESAIPSDIHKN